MNVPVAGASARAMQKMRRHKERTGEWCPHLFPREEVSQAAAEVCKLLAYDGTSILEWFDG